MPLRPFFRRFFLIALASASVAGVSHAQVYKCERNGVLSYSDQPCTEKSARSQALDIRAASGSALKESASLDIKHYDVHGQTLEDVWRDIRAKGPQGFHGMATWKIGLTYTFKREGNTCRISALELRNQGTILMPRWVEQAQAPRELVTQWDRYYAALKRHEDGHIATSNEFQTQVRRDLMGLAPQACDRIEPVIRSTYERLHKIYSDKDIEYDRRTNHGLNQDAPRGPL